MGTQNEYLQLKYLVNLVSEEPKNIITNFSANDFNGLNPKYL